MNGKTIASTTPEYKRTNGNTATTIGTTADSGNTPTKALYYGYRSRIQLETRLFGTPGVANSQSIHMDSCFVFILKANEDANLSSKTQIHSDEESYEEP